jgi:hypothetical protein
VAVALTRDEHAQVLLADNGDVLSRLVALRWVGQTAPSVLGDRVEGIREALLEERWGGAVFLWMEATGSVVDGYPDEDFGPKNGSTKTEHRSKSALLPSSNSWGTNDRDCRVLRWLIFVPPSRSWPPV